MTNLIELYESILNECDGGACAGGDAGAVGSVGGDAGADLGAVDSVEVVGDCYHSGGGYLHDGCFHVPAYVQTPFSRYGTDGSNRKKGKNGKPKQYYPEKNMKIITTYEQLVAEEENKEQDNL